MVREVRIIAFAAASVPKGAVPAQTLARSENPGVRHDVFAAELPVSNMVIQAQSSCPPHSEVPALSLHVLVWPPPWTVRTPVRDPETDRVLETTTESQAYYLHCVDVRSRSPK